MNTPLRRLSTVMILMFVALMAASTWVQYVMAPQLNSDARNVRTLYREYGKPRGPIVVGGEAVAYSVPVDTSFRYLRTYADGPLYAPVTGFYSVVYTRSGLEQAMNTELNGTADSLFLSRLQDLITGRQPQGASVELTLDPVAQQAAWDALGGQTGAVVAIDPATGAILAMVSSPSFDPNVLAGHATPEVNAAWTALTNDPAQPMVNRAIAGDTYAPGSVFKLVTAAAALESGLSPDTMVEAPDRLDLPQTSATIGNFGGSSCSAEGTISLADALRISCNTAFGRLGLDLGDDVLREQARAFGFDTALAVPLAVTESRYPDDPDLPQTALTAIGQHDVRVTPLQIAMISAAIANDGVLMKPYLVEIVRNEDLTSVASARPTELGRSVSATTARELREMMVAVVESGTGRGARIAGVAVAGKSGTAQTGPDEAPHAWFTAFAPAENPRIAIAVVVEHGGNMGDEATGGAIAAPIARQVIEAVLAR